MCVLHLYIYIQLYVTLIHIKIRLLLSIVFLPVKMAFFPMGRNGFLLGIKPFFQE